MTDENEPDDRDDGLALCGTDDLISELFRRFDHAVFASLKIRGPEDQSLIRRWYGHDVTCLGLCDRARRQINDHIDDNSEPGEMEDV